MDQNGQMIILRTIQYPGPVKLPNSGILPVLMPLLAISLAAMMLMLRIRGISEEINVVLIFGVICLVSVGLLFSMFRTLNRADQI